MSVTYIPDADVLARFEVVGDPKPQGSKAAFNAKGTGKAMMRESGGAGFAAWRNAVSEAARRVAGPVKLDGPMTLHAHFRFAMPKGRTDTKAKRAAIFRNDGWAWKTTAPDTSKLVRLVEDSMQAAGLIADDARFAQIDASKVEVATGWTGVVIWIERLH